MKSTGRKTSLGWAWIILATGIANFLFIYGVRLGYGIILPQMSESLALTKAQGGLIYSAFFFVYLIFSPLLGNLTDRIGPRRIIISFSLLLVAGPALMGRISGFREGVLFFGLTGVGAAGLYSPIISLVQGWFEERRRGAALGMLQMGSALGIALTGLILPVLISRYDWRTSWQILGGAAFLVVVMNALYLRDAPELNPGSGRPRPPRRAAYGEILRLPRFWIIGFSYMFIAAAFYALFTFLVMYGVREVGISHAVASAFMTLMALAGLCGAPAILYLSDRIGRWSTILICQFCIILATMGLILAQGNAAGLLFSVGALGFFFHPIWPSYAACARDYFRENVTGTIIGLWTIFYGTGGVAGPAISGYLADRTGTFLYSFLFAMVCVSLSSLSLILNRSRLRLNRGAVPK